MFKGTVDIQLKSGMSDSQRYILFKPQKDNNFLAIKIIIHLSLKRQSFKWRVTGN